MPMIPEYVRKDLVEYLINYYGAMLTWSKEDILSEIKRNVQENSTSDITEVKHSKWIQDGDFLICINCESEINIKNSLGIENKKDYCPCCGAKMDLKGGINK